MVTLEPLDGLDPRQRPRLEQWAAVSEASGRAALGDSHTAWTVEDLLGLWRATDRQREAVVALEADGAAVGAAQVVMPLHDNHRLATVHVSVLPDRRRRGTGSGLLEWAEGVAARHGRTVLLAETEWAAGGEDRSGTGFAQRHGFLPAQTVLRSTLELPRDRAGRARLAAAAGNGTGGDYALETSLDGIPESWLQDRAVLQQRMSTDAPLGAVELDEEHWTPTRLREELQRTVGSGRSVIETVAREGRTGRLVGFTQVQVAAATPEVAYQQDTLVLREHRGHGLGLRLKAANTLRLLERHPDVRVVRTWNAEDNAHMLAVNRALGYVGDAWLREWQKIVPAGT